MPTPTFMTYTAPSFTLSTVTDSLATAMETVESCISNVLGLVGSNVYLQIGFGVTLLGLGIAVIKKLRRI